MLRHCKALPATVRQSNLLLKHRTGTLIHLSTSACVEVLLEIKEKMSLTLECHNLFIGLSYTSEKLQTLSTHTKIPQTKLRLKTFFSLTLSSNETGDLTHLHRPCDATSCLVNRLASAITVGVAWQSGIKISGALRARRASLASEFKQH